MIKFLDIVNFKEIFDSTYITPTRKPKPLLRFGKLGNMGKLGKS